MEMLGQLAKKGMGVAVTSKEFPSVKFGIMEKSIRGIEVNEDENGYEIRICIFASKEDYELFANTIAVVMEMTGGKAYCEDDDEDEVEDPIERFNAVWAEKTLECTFMATRAMVHSNGAQIVVSGLLCDLCIGPHMYNWFKIPLTGEYPKEEVGELMDYCRSIQWFCGNCKGTNTEMGVRCKNGETLPMTTISISDGKVNEFDYIANAELVCLMDTDNPDEYSPVFLPIAELGKILPNRAFRAIDELQYQRTGEVTVEMVHQMMERAKRFATDDYGYKPTKPGEGYDEQQNTFILMWNPDISSVSLEEHNSDVANMYIANFNWSVWEHEKAKLGDRFFMVKVGDGNTGIVMSGVFTSNPYEAEDWSGKGRQTFYMDMKPNAIMNPTTAPMITTKQLMKEIPSFKWTGGHSGRLLTKEEGRRLEAMWHEYIVANADKVDGVNLNAVRLGL